MNFLADLRNGCCEVEPEELNKRGGNRMKYKVWVCLECEYDNIEADSEEEAFQIASDAAMFGGSWTWTVSPVEVGNG